LSESPRDLDAVLKEVEFSLVTIEVSSPDGTTQYGSGFFVSDDGYAVCSSFLLSGGGEITAYISEGISVSAELKGMDEKLGIALIRLPHEYQYTPIPVENSFFVERGRELCAVSSYKPKSFYGTVARGIVGSVGPAVQVGQEGIYTNIIYLDIDMNKTLQGAVVVDESGAAVGFLTVGLPSLHGTLVPVIPINIVYTVINDFLAQG
jgi:serine protease Do